MRRAVGVGALLLAGVPALAQVRQPAQTSTLPTTTPQEFDVLDKTGAWVPFGSVDASHKFLPANLPAPDPRPSLTPQDKAFACPVDPADGTACIQSVFDAAAAQGAKVWFDGVHLYRITASLNIPNPLTIEGPFRYGIWPVNQPGGGANAKCPWGLVTYNTGITMINATAITGSIDGVCIDMTGVATTQPSAGAAIDLKPPGAAAYQSGWRIENNTILQTYLAIGLNGAGYAGGCCGKGTIADGVFVARNTIVNPAYAAIEVGKNTRWAATVGITLVDNNIVCGKDGNARGKGVLIHDGGVFYDGSQNGPEGCSVGFEVAPAGDATNPQWAQFDATGVLGDQSTIYDFWVHPGDYGWISMGRVRGGWANQTANGMSVLIDCTATTQAYCDGLTISDTAIFGGTGQAQPIVDVEAGGAGPFNFSFLNNQVRQGGSGAAAGGVALKLKVNANSNYAGNWTISGNQINAASLGCCSTGVNPIGLLLDTAATTSLASGAMNITGNNFTNHLNASQTPVSYTPRANGDDNVIFANNIGVDGETRSVTAAATLTLDNAFPTYSVSGTTTIQTINGVWRNRKITLVAAGSSTLNLGTSGNICANPVVNANMVMLHYVFGGSCWEHVP